jgi:peptidoglycan/LPS O-acetylase OafA/YrhL
MKFSEARRVTRGQQQLKRPSLFADGYQLKELIFNLPEHTTKIAGSSHQPQPLVRHQFRPDIEGLRAIAVSLVVLDHIGFPFLRAGFIGVDVFFVLSGYLITGLLTKELAASGRVDLSRFYAQRVRRLLPAATFVLLIVCMTQTIVASPLAQSGVLKAALATILYSSNIYFAHLHLYYFTDAAAPSPLLHTWSLAVEEQFYLVWPIFILLLTRIAKDIRTRILIIAAITVISFIGSVWLTTWNPVLQNWPTHKLL